MTNKQKQWQLYFLGYYGDSTEDIDGLWGPKSEAATKEFQEDIGITADGIFGPHTEAKTKEVIDNIQDLVADYGIAGLVNDGLAGPKTMAAAVWYQKAVGLTPNGVIDPETRAYMLTDTKPPLEKETDAFWDEIEYFTRDELRCKCGGRYCNGFPAEPKEMTVRLADRARKHFGRPAHNVSFLRCATWNAKNGGVVNSQHMHGEAMDIRIDGISADELYRFFLAQPEVRYTYKINSTNVHFDIPKGAR